MAANIAIVGLSLYQAGFPTVGTCPQLGLPMIGFVILFSQVGCSDGPAETATVVLVMRMKSAWPAHHPTQSAGMAVRSAHTCSNSTCSGVRLGRTDARHTPHRLKHASMSHVGSA